MKSMQKRSKVASKKIPTAKNIIRPFKDNKKNSDFHEERAVSPLTIMELESIRNGDSTKDMSLCTEIIRNSDQSLPLSKYNEDSESDFLKITNPSHFGQSPQSTADDQESQGSNSTTEVTVFVPQTTRNAYMVMSHKAGGKDKASNNNIIKGCNNNLEGDIATFTASLSAAAAANGCRSWETLANFKSTVGSTGYMALQTTSGWLLAKIGSSVETLIAFIGILLLFCFFYPWVTVLGVGIFVYLLSQLESGSKPTKRTIRWTIQDYTREMSHNFLTCPPFDDKSGQWRLAVCQKCCMDGIQTTFGLIATNIPEDVQSVKATIRFSCTNIYGQEISSGMKDLKFVHEFECSGDCGYTRPIMFSRRQLGSADTLNIICRIDFKRVDVGILKYLRQNFSHSSSNSLVGRNAGGRRHKSRNNVVEEFGCIQPETVAFQPMLSMNMQSIARFVQHPETKTFIWEIPNFSLLMKSREVWGIFSPQFFVNSHDFCSIWRLKLIEVQGVFRLHVQLRGLPRAMNQIKLWYLLQLVDNFGDSVVPEHSVTRIKYPDHMNLWDTTRHILYRRETLVARFLTVGGSLTIRLSLQIQPNDLALLEADSDEWICPH